MVGLEGTKQLLNLTVLLSEGVLHVCFGSAYFLIKLAVSKIILKVLIL